MVVPFVCCVETQPLLPLWNLNDIAVFVLCLLLLCIFSLFRMKELVLVGNALPLLALVTLDF